MEQTTRPCVYPGCRDTDGNPRITRDVICESCRRRYERALFWLVEDYVRIHEAMPEPVSDGQMMRHATEDVFGHPAEWASDVLADIASKLNGWEDTLRDHLGHDPAVHPGHSEVRRVALALDYLLNWFDRFCSFPAAADAASELDELHRSIRSALERRDLVKVPTPCPRCDLRTLVRAISEHEDYVVCRNSSCGVRIDQSEYHLWTKVLADSVLRHNSTDVA